MKSIDIQEQADELGYLVHDPHIRYVLAVIDWNFGYRYYDKWGPQHTEAVMGKIDRSLAQKLDRSEIFYHSATEEDQRVILYGAKKVPEEDVARAIETEFIPHFLAAIHHHTFDFPPGTVEGVILDKETGYHGNLDAQRVTFRGAALALTPTASFEQTLLVLEERLAEAKEGVRTDMLQLSSQAVSPENPGGYIFPHQMSKPHFIAHPKYMQ